VSSGAFRQARHGQNAWARHVERVVSCETWRYETSGIWAYVCTLRRHTTNSVMMMMVMMICWWCSCRRWVLVTLESQSIMSRRQHIIMIIVVVVIVEVTVVALCRRCFENLCSVSAVCESKSSSSWSVQHWSRKPTSAAKRKQATESPPFHCSPLRFLRISRPFLKVGLNWDILPFPRWQRTSFGYFVVIWFWYVSCPDRRRNGTFSKQSRWTAYRILFA